MSIAHVSPASKLALMMRRSARQRNVKESQPSVDYSTNTVQKAKSSLNKSVANSNRPSASRKRKSTDDNEVENKDKASDRSKENTHHKKLNNSADNSAIKPGRESVTNSKKQKLVDKSIKSKSPIKTAPNLLKCGNENKGEQKDSRKVTGRTKRKSVLQVSSYKECQGSDADSESDYQGSAVSSDSEQSDDSLDVATKQDVSKKKHVIKTEKSNPIEEKSGSSKKKSSSKKQSSVQKSKSQSLSENSKLPSANEIYVGKRTKVVTEFEIAKSKPRISAKENKKLAISIAKHINVKVAKEESKKRKKTDDDSSSDDEDDWEEVEGTKLLAFFCKFQTFFSK